MEATPQPSVAARIVRALVVVSGGFGLALLCFVILPLLQAISATDPPDLQLTSVDTAALPPPPPPPQPEEEAEPEKAEEPKPPELAEAAAPLDLAQLELALNPGVGGGEGVAGDFAIKIVGAGGGGDKGVDELFSLADLDQKPRPVFQQQPTLGAALKKKLPANVVVVFTVDQQGRVESPIVQSASDPAFEAPVLAAIRQWKFEPGKRGGKPVRFRMRQPFSFQ